MMQTTQQVFESRAAGILMPVSSLPANYGIGSFGKAAYQWVDFLHKAGQTYWQVLPLGPTGFGDSPYQSFSAFAGNPYFIDLDLLCADGLLTKAECEAVNWGQNTEKVDYATLFKHREPLLRKAFSRFKNYAALEKFRKENAAWVEDYALYMAVKEKMGLRPWPQWEQAIRLRQPQATRHWQQQEANNITYTIFVQYLFYSQWQALKQYANGKGVYIIGDIPIYVAMDSADTWAHSELFLLDENKNPVEVAGCPPDGFSADGQLWGNPLYNWQVMRQNGYAWWVARLRASLTMYDVLRIDHFRGFESYYAIPASAKTAVEGEWRKGPGMQFIGEVNRQLGKANIIAEDLGYLTDDVRALLRQSGYPGMKVLQFAFDTREDSDYLAHNYERNCVVYTGTHDNDTTHGWFENALPDDVALAKEYLNIHNADEGCWCFIRAAMGSVARIAIIPLQDYLNLGSEARMNTPATIGGNNWRWRANGAALTEELAAKIARLTKLYGRKRI
ncbi:4-alpha-glucanotransferase [Ruminococcaceae bacterium OttesenSCG-928-A16]|nr:4-alpha-glucanotransferase [Ruminococcaceae bacterium OttesenSCG-928-A16]